MTAGLELLRIVTDGLFILLGFRALVQCWRVRDTEHLYFALFCGTILMSTLLYEISWMDGSPTNTEVRLFGYALIAHPYFLLRIAATVRPLPRWVMRSATIGLLYSIVIVTVGDWSDGQFAVGYVPASIYFFAAQAMAAYAFWRESREVYGLFSNRFLYILIGSILVIVTVTLMVAFQFLRPATPFEMRLYDVVTFCTAVAYWIGFDPPAFVRRGWQAAQIMQFQSTIIGELINKPADKILRFLAKSSLSAVAGQDAILISYNIAQSRLSLTSLTEELSFTLAPEEFDGFNLLITDFNTEPSYVRRRDIPDDRASACIMDGFGARAMYSIPVVNLPSAVTILVITLRTGSLFVQDDLSTMRRYAGQTRAILENNSLIAETQNLVEELRDETGDLEEMVLEREQALRASEDELRRRLVQMSQLYRELEAFSYSVSHDLRAPLRAISGFSTALAEDFGEIFPPEALEYLQRINANSHKMNDLMNDMLKLSKLSRSEMAFSEFDLTDAAVRVGHELRALYPAHDVAFNVRSGLTARADPALAKVLLTNLLSNAWKFTQRTVSPTITFEANVVNGENVYRVSDNGAGFDMLYVDKLFKPFQRLHADGEFDGNGIGLAIVQRIVNRHGGRVWAEGQPGKGARFYFTLPGRVT